MANRFWVGGTGTWDASSTGHWSATSGGGAGASAPSTGDSAFFDGNSGTGTITISGNLDIGNCDFTGYTGTFIGGSNINCILGTFKFGSGMTTTWTGNVIVQGTTGLITSAGKSFGGSVSFSATNNSIPDDLITTGNVSFNGTFTDNGHNITCRNVNINGGCSITMGNCTWTITGNDTTNNAAFYLASGSITITCNANNLVKFTDTTNNQCGFDCGNNGSGATFTFGNAWFSRGASTGINYIGGNFTAAGYIKDDGSATHSLLAEHQKTITCGDFICTGTVSKTITLNCANGWTSTFALVKTGGGVISCDYMNIQHCVATPSSTWYAGTHSTNNQAVANAGSGWIFTAPPTATTMTATQQSYTLTLQSALLHLGRKLLATFQTYALTMQAAILRVGHTLTATMRTYALTLQAAIFSANRKLLATFQTYTLTLQSALFHYAAKMLATFQTYTLSLQAVIFKLGKFMIATMQTYTLTLQSALFHYAAKMLAVMQTYTLSLQAAILTINRKMVATMQTYVLSLQDALFKLGHGIVAAMQTYTLTLEPALFHFALSVKATMQSYTLILQSAIFSANRKMVATLQTYALTLQDALLHKAVKLIAAMQTYTLSLQAALFHKGYGLIASVQTYVLTLQSALFHKAVKIIATMQTYTLTGIAVIVGWRRTMVAAFQTYTLTLQSALFHYGARMYATLQTYTLTGKNVRLIFNGVVEAWTALTKHASNWINTLRT